MNIQNSIAETLNFRFAIKDKDGPVTAPQFVDLGFHIDSTYLRQYQRKLGSPEIAHIALNLRFNNADLEVILKRLAAKVCPKL